VNIAFFLLPKNDTVYLSIECTMRQAMEKMEHHSYSALPVIDKEGKYIGTITEGDLLWKLKNSPGLNFDGTRNIWLKDIPRKWENKPVSINAHMEDLLSLAALQNFVPVTDDVGTFIGIIRRREIIEYCIKLIDKTD
jgi:CBS-domain-containing membrane protein